MNVFNAFFRDLYLKIDKTVPIVYTQFQDLYRVCKLLSKYLNKTKHLAVKV